ncbi:MAG: extradiol ring-cleavage dioxygenase [Acidimicrobiales bacterium]
MAAIAAIVASTHHPFYFRTSQLPPDEQPPFAPEWIREVEQFRETLTVARPDLLVLVGSDHFHQLWLDNMPQFLVGNAPVYDTNWYDEEREFALPKMKMVGNTDLSRHLLRSGLDDGFDLAFSNELRLDHSVTCPIITLRPQNDLPVVPIYTNVFAPPLPQPSRFVALGAARRRWVESWESDLRVAIIGTGHLSLELGGPLQFGPHGPSPEFDAQAVDWIANSKISKALQSVSLESLALPDNVTYGFMDFLLMMGAVGESVRADYVDTYDLFHTTEACFTWYSKEVPL